MHSHTQEAVRPLMLWTCPDVGTCVFLQYLGFFLTDSAVTFL